MNMYNLSQEIIFSYDYCNNSKKYTGIISIKIPRTLIPLFLKTKEKFIFLYHNTGIIKITKRKFNKILKIFEKIQLKPYGYTHDFIDFIFNTENNKITYSDSKYRNKEA